MARLTTLHCARPRWTNRDVTRILRRRSDLNAHQRTNAAAVAPRLICGPLGTMAAGRGDGTVVVERRCLDAVDAHVRGVCEAASSTHTSADAAQRCARRSSAAPPSHAAQLTVTAVSPRLSSRHVRAWPSAAEPRFRWCRGCAGWLPSGNRRVRLWAPCACSEHLVMVGVTPRGCPSAGWGR